MYLYKNGKGSAFRWNSVDVEVDGRLQHGHVIGLRDGDGHTQRLIVDFGCRTQRALMVEYGKVFDGSTQQNKNIYGPRSYPRGSDPLLNCRVSTATKKTDLQVLLRATPDKPWIWYPGKLLMCNVDDLPDYVLVDATVEGRSARQLLPKQQLRRPPSGKRLRQRLLRPGHFVLRMCSLPAAYWTITEPAVRHLFPRKMQQDNHLHVVAILGPTIYYLQQATAIRMTDENLAKLVSKTMNNFTQQHQLTIKEPPTEGNEAARGSKRKRQFDTEEEPFCLPPELLVEILHTLDTLDRQRCRRTCALFDKILTHGEMRKELRLSLDDTDAFLNWNYAAYSCIFKLITPATRTIAIRDRRMEEPHYLCMEIQTYTGKAVRYMKMVLDDAGIHIDRLIIYRRSICITAKTSDMKFSQYLDSLWDVYAGLASCCDRLVWKDVVWRYSNYYRPPVVQFCIPHAVCSLQRLDVAMIWDLFEQYVCSDQTLDVERIAQLTRNLITGKSETDCRKLIEILCEYQTNDPRKQGSDWIPSWPTTSEGSLTVEHLAGLDVWKLNKICLSAWWTLYIQTNFCGLSPVSL